MRTAITIILVSAFGRVVTGQNAIPVVGYGYSLPVPIPVAPGQLLTVVVPGPNDGTMGPGGNAQAGADLPLSLAGISATFAQTVTSVQLSANISAPLLQVYPCLTHLVGGGCTGDPLGVDFGASGTKLLAVTLQIPFEGVACSVVGCTAPGQPALIQAGLWVAGATAGTDPGRAWIRVVPASDQVHILTDCDSFLLYGTGRAAPTLAPSVPCPSIVTHADGSRVSAANPAKSGEEVVAYALGLGQTTPPLTTGKLVTAAASTLTTFGLDFNFHPNALASRPLPSAPPPVYAGATAGYVGLYQINFVVPPVPAGTTPCDDPGGKNLLVGSNFVQSNLTVSIGGTFSFDGARICAAPNR